MRHVNLKHQFSKRLFCVLWLEHSSHVAVEILDCPACVYDSHCVNKTFVTYSQTEHWKRLWVKWEITKQDLEKAVVSNARYDRNIGLTKTKNK